MDIQKLFILNLIYAVVSARKLCLYYIFWESIDFYQYQVAGESLEVLIYSKFGCIMTLTCFTQK